MTSANVIYGEMAKIIKIYGQTITYKEINTGSYNPITGKEDNTEIKYEGVKGQFLSFKTEEIDNFNILSTDSKLLIPPDVDFIPKNSDFITHNSIVYLIIRVRKITVRDTIVAYILQVRNA